MSYRFGKKRSLKRRIKRFFSRPLLKLALVVIPRIYHIYMTFVWLTSKKEYYGIEKFIECLKQDKGIVGLFWHENVFFVAYTFRELNASTLASKSDFGELITRMLKLCNFKIFRGGSSRGKSRRDTGVLATMIQHMKTHNYIIYGITVDGSKGPVYNCKKGAVVISKETGSPMFPVHIISKPTFRVPSWDRTRIALPFGHIVIFIEGPYYCSPNANNEEIETQRIKMERAMMDNMKRAEHYLKTGKVKISAIPATKNIESTIRRGHFMLKSGENFYPILK